MTTHRFSTGKKFRWGGEHYEIKRLLPSDRLCIQVINSGESREVDMETLVTAWMDERLFFDMPIETPLSSPTRHTTFADLSDYPEKEIAVARYRLAVIQPLLALPPGKRTEAAVGQRVAEVISPTFDQPNPNSSSRVSVRSLYRWLSLYESGGHDLLVLCPHTGQRGGKGKTRLPQEITELIDSVARDFYSRREKVTVTDVRDIVAVRAREENQRRPEQEQLTCPCWGSIARRILALDLPAQKMRRQSRHGARRSAKQYGQNRYPTLPLERVEIDHTRVDIIVVDEETGLPLGRPTLTYCLDVATRYPLGFYIGFEPPGYYAVMECLHHAICPKGNIQEKYSTQHDWIAFGVPHTLVVDNAKEFIGRDLTDACDLLGIELVRSPVVTPEFKAAIERHFRTLSSGLFHTLPGTTFSNLQQRGEYDSVQNACLSLDDLTKILHIFVIDVYAQEFHRGLEGIPACQWEKTVHDCLFSPRLPTDPQELLILLSRIEWRTLHHYGIDFEHLRYNCPELGALRARFPTQHQRVKIKYHPGDLHCLHVQDPAQPSRYIEVPANDPEYTNGLSLWKHRVIRNFARAQWDRTDSAALGQAKMQIQGIVQVARVRKKAATRTRLARWQTSGVPPNQLSPIPTVDKPAPSANLPSILPSGNDEDWEIGIVPT